MGMRIKLFIPLLLFGVATLTYVGTVWLPQLSQLMQQQRLVAVAEEVAPLMASGRTGVAARKLAPLMREDDGWLRLELRNASGQMLYATPTRVQRAPRDTAVRTLRQPLTRTQRCPGKQGTASQYS